MKYSIFSLQKLILLCGLHVPMEPAAYMALWRQAPSDSEILHSLVWMILLESQGIWKWESFQMPQKGQRWWQETDPTDPQMGPLPPPHRPVLLGLR